MKLLDDFKEFIDLLISKNVQFVMIGGFAYNLYQNPRATGDIDFLVKSDLENQLKLRDALMEFGFGSALPQSDLIIPHGKMLMLGRAPFRIDLLTSIDGVSYAEVAETAQVFKIDGIKVPVISPAMLLRNKVAAGRPKDLEDAKKLEYWLKNKSR